MDYEPNPTEHMLHYRRRLPHWQPERAMFFITLRLANSLPSHIVQELRAAHEREKRTIHAKSSSVDQAKERYTLDEKYFEHFDEWLDRCINESPRWLADERVARIVTNEIHRLDGQRYLLIAYCLMPNHIHLVIDTTEHAFKPVHRGVTANYPLTDTMKLLKGRTARLCNQVLGRNGSFWQAESYDHVIRNQQEYEHIVWYTLNNPVKAGLVEQWEDWSHTYLAARNDFLSP